MRLARAQRGPPVRNALVCDAARLMSRVKLLTNIYAFPFFVVVFCVPGLTLSRNSFTATTRFFGPFAPPVTMCTLCKSTPTQRLPPSHPCNSCPVASAPCPSLSRLKLSDDFPALAFIWDAPWRIDSCLHLQPHRLLQVPGAGR